MRVKKELVVERETLVRELFVSDPELSVKVVNEKLKEKFGRTMSLKRVYELRAEVTGSTQLETATAVAPRAAS